MFGRWRQWERQPLCGGLEKLKASFTRAIHQTLDKTDTFFIQLFLYTHLCKHLSVNFDHYADCSLPNAGREQIHLNSGDGVPLRKHRPTRFSVVSRNLNKVKLNGFFSATLLRTSLIINDDANTLYFYVIIFYTIRRINVSRNMFKSSRKSFLPF